ncbi:MAG TPA: hypothetical protein V6D25_25285 [Leptolyngbyaceae cyanobacterium]
MTNTTVAAKIVGIIQQMQKVIGVLLLTAVIFVSFNAPSYAQSSLCTSIVSQPQPQSGQNNRSSGNFTTQDCQGPRLEWRVPGNIEFNVMEDKSGGTDPVILRDARSGTVTGVFGQRSIYIANPRNATESFTVQVLNIQ